MRKNQQASAEKASVGARIIHRLQGFVDALESRRPLAGQFTCRRVVLNLAPTPYDAAKVKETRRFVGASQAVFAKLLGVSLNTVRAWEQGVNRPSDMACRFLDEIRRDPAYWVRRLKEAVVAG